MLLSWIILLAIVLVITVWFLGAAIYIPIRDGIVCHGEWGDAWPSLFISTPPWGFLELVGFAALPGTRGSIDTNLKVAAFITVQFLTAVVITYLLVKVGGMLDAKFPKLRDSIETQRRHRARNPEVRA